MNTIRLLSAAVLAAMLTLFVLPAPAQGNFDATAAKTVVVDGPRLIIGASSSTVTSSQIDTRGFQGIAKLTLFACTNSDGTVTATVKTSPDTNTWTALQNYSLATATSLHYTNSALANSTNEAATDTFLLHGTLTTPSPNTGTYVLPAPRTNSGAVSLVGKQFYEISFDVSDQNRYLQVVWTTGGTVTNVVVGAVLSGYAQGALK